MIIKDKTVVITGGTDGIGAATALELKRQGARVWIIGRSSEKGDRLVADALREGGVGSLNFLQADFSLMSNVSKTVEQLQDAVPRIDILVHCVGILIAHKAYTSEGIEKDFAVGYLSRFVMTKALVVQKLLDKESIVVNVAASSPKIPKMAKLEFNDLATVEARFGMQSHGQAQMANDLFSLEASRRWGLSVIGYGPGSVDTGIRRELPPLLVALIKPFFFFSTRKPQQVALQFAQMIESQSPPSGETWFFHKKGRFTPDAFVLDPNRRRELWSASEALEQKALGYGAYVVA
ncbi:MAG: SDR family NAD(P)-dependent oxidoreductase [Roseiflexaceae bacterium]|nr:SDR family NAD(P)-dependent oxidoreductase [Roseiflexaceae bacterium]